MDLKTELRLKQTQQLVMTPQLQQAIRLLQLSRLELVEMVQQEMLENPVLDEAGPPDNENEISIDRPDDKDPAPEKMPRAETFLVKLEEVATVIPTDTPAVSVEDRQRQIAVRQAHIKQRWRAY